MTRDLDAVSPRGGVVLAGGRSRRFGGEDKAVATLVDRPMIRHVADRLVPVIDELVVNCRADQRPAIAEALTGLSVPHSFAIDPEPDLGPMAGIATGLSGLDRAPVAVVVACDMPFVDPAIVRYLFGAIESADAAVPRIEGEWLETTHAVYRAEPMIEACREALEADESRIVSAIDRVSARIVDAEEIRAHGTLESFENINTQEELIAAEERLTGRDRDPESSEGSADE